MHSIVKDMIKAGFSFESNIVKSKERLKLDAFQKVFNDYFCIWDIQLPLHELICKESGVIREAGWIIKFHFEKTDKKEYMMDVNCCHNQTDDRHFRIYEDGTREDLPACPAII